MRGIVVVTGALVLGCAGFVGTNQVDREGFSLEMLDGTVTEDRDQGAAGDYNVEFALTTQSLSWQPILPDESLEDTATSLRVAMIALLAEEDLEVTGEPPLVPGTVDGEPSIAFELEVDGARIHSTSWTCADAGLQITLNTTGLAVGSRHEASVASVRCKHDPVELRRDEPQFVFTGSEARWPEGGEPDPGDYAWDRVDGAMSVYVNPMTGTIGDELSACHVLMDIAIDNLGLELDPEANRFEALDGGCIRDFRASDAEGGASGRFVYRRCGADGFMATCIAQAREDSRTCDSLVRCPETAE